ncbi:cytochrome P450, partial [Mycolicibacterium monacense DSM 44395]
MTALTAQLTSPANTHRLQVAGAALTSRFPSREEPLATPPPGSNLKPVMGNYGFPFLGHTLSALAEPLDFARRRYDMYGPVSWAGGV